MAWSDEDLDAVKAPWGYICEYFYDMPVARDAIYSTNNTTEYLSIQPATFTDRWSSHQYYGNANPDFWISEGREETWIIEPQYQ
jgi:hypothetical protein